MIELVDFAGLECAGCGTTSEQLVEQEDWTEKDIDDNGVWLNCGDWYCHDDCLRDSR